MSQPAAWRSRLGQYAQLILTLSILYLTQVAIPAPCTTKGTLRPGEGTSMTGTGRVDLFDADTALLFLESRNFQCRRCSDIVWDIIRQGKLVDAEIQRVGDTFEVTITKTGDPVGLQFGDTIYIEGTYDDPIGLNPLTGNPFFTVQRTVRANIMIKLK